LFIYAAALQINGTAISFFAFGIARRASTVYQRSGRRWGNNLNEKRIASRKRVLKGAFIVLSDKAPKLECTIKNMSDTGALIQVSSTFGLPANFDLIIDMHRHHCHVIWRTDTKIGIRFE
jgi:hypothetical protein